MILPDLKPYRRLERFYMTEDRTTLVCLFHHRDQAQAAIRNLLDSGVPQASISLIDESGTASTDYSSTSLRELGVPDRDQNRLMEGVNKGGMIVAVAAIADHVQQVETIFENHKATKFDEAVITPTAPVVAAAPPVTAPATVVAGEMAIPIVEEELQVGKRNVDRGGVRLYRRVVEIPVEESVTLHEEHINVERRPVDRAVSQGDLASQGERTIELKETAEEAVVGKTARVTEEVLLNKESFERTDQIHDTVRKTEVEVEQIPATAATSITESLPSRDR